MVDPDEKAYDPQRASKFLTYGVACPVDIISETIIYNC